METRIWYSVCNAGDGSAYPVFMESEELAEIDQKFMDEGWAGSCTGCLVVESESPVTVKEMVTAKEVVEEIEEELAQNYMIEYKKAGQYPEWFARLEGKLAAVKALIQKGTERTGGE